MKAAKGNIARAVEQPDPKIRFYLFLGEDQAQSRGLAGRLVEALGSEKFALSASELKGQPGLLADEAAALSLFGERRLIWIEPASNDILEAVETLLAAERVESPVVAIAGALPRSSPLLKLAEASAGAIAFTAYLPDDKDAERMVSEAGRRLGLKVAPHVAARVAAAAGNDQAVVGQELEKFAIFLDASPHSPKELDLDAIEAVGADHAEGDFARIADLALEGNLAELSEELAKLSPNGAEAIPVVRSLQRRLLMLAPIRARVDRGEKPDAVMASAGKSMFWKDKPLVQRMIRTWTADDLARVSERVGQLERRLMFSDAPQREALGEELTAIARRAMAKG